MTVSLQSYFFRVRSFNLKFVCYVCFFLKVSKIKAAVVNQQQKKVNAKTVQNLEDDSANGTLVGASMDATGFFVC